MRKYMKYEIKGNYKFILGVIAIIIIASTIIQFNLSRQINYSNDDIVGVRAILFIISGLTMFGTFLVAFFHIVGSFRKELYEDRGYLTFTLPLTGYKILGAKLTVAIMWFLSLGITMAVYNTILSMILYGQSMSTLLGMIGNTIGQIKSEAIIMGILIALSGILTLVLVYFSIALSRVSIRNKKVGGFWFIIFLILNTLSGYITYLISEKMPYYLNISNMKTTYLYNTNILQNLTTRQIGNLMILGRDLGAHINIFGFISIIVMIIAVFLGTGYLIDKKIDL